MKLKKLIAIASRGYPDGLVAEAAKGKDVDDTLATFIAKELSGISETDSDHDQLVEAMRLMDIAMHDLQGVYTELSHCAENAKRKADEVKPLYPEKAKRARKNRLLPNGVPRYVRVYDSGGSGDRYTVVFTGNWKDRNGLNPFLGMSGAPFHPQGVCQHGETYLRPVDCRPGQWGGASMGRSCHLGKRIPFSKLPKDCQTAVLNDYKSYWNLP